jgi:hypothetical protein
MTDDAPVRPIQQAWQHYCATCIGVDVADPELQGRRDAFLHGARATFGLLYALIHHADGLDEISLVFERMGEELGFDDTSRDSSRGDISGG